MQAYASGMGHAIIEDASLKRAQASGRPYQASLQPICIKLSNFTLEEGDSK